MREHFAYVCISVRQVYLPPEYPTTPELCSVDQTQGFRHVRQALYQLSHIHSLFTVTVCLIQLVYEFHSARKLTVCLIFSTWSSQYLTFGSVTLNNPHFSNGDLRGMFHFPPSSCFLFLCPPAPRVFSMCLNCEYSKPIILNMNWWLHAWTLSFTSWNHGP